MPLTTEEEAVSYLVASGDMSEFRRLRKWLHQDDMCAECITVIDRLLEVCNTKSGQDSLRHLHLERHVYLVTQMRLQNSGFPPVLLKSLVLIGRFCAGNLQNQKLMADNAETRFLPLLDQPQYVDGAAYCLSTIVNENEQVSLKLGETLLSGVEASARIHGRQLGLLALLQQTLIIDGKPVPVSQIRVCKGVTMSPHLLELNGDLSLGQWGDGPALTRVEVIQTVLEGTAQAAMLERCLRGCRCARQPCTLRGWQAQL